MPYGHITAAVRALRPCAPATMARRAASQLAQIEAGLAKAQPVRTGDRSSIVAAVLRQPHVRPHPRGDGHSSHPQGLDCLFILRSSDPQGSRWSGQVAFPGGHVEEGESDLEAVARECREEVGLHLDAPGHYRCIGRVSPEMLYGDAFFALPLRYRLALCLTPQRCTQVADRSVYRSEKQSSLLVRCYVFEQLIHEPMTADPAEVAACGWTPLDALLHDDLIVPLPAVVGGDDPLWSGFASVPLPITDDDMALPVGREMSKADCRARFALWGLTLSICNDWLTSCEMRRHAIALPKQAAI